MLTRGTIAVLLALSACAHATTARPTSTDVSAVTGPAALAQVYFWRARPGMLDAYNRYIRDIAEPIDAEAQRAGAFVSVTTFVAGDSALSWTHMRLFLLRDSAQLNGLSAALAAAGARLQPDTALRRRQGEYAATLRDRVGASVLAILGQERR